MSSLLWRQRSVAGHRAEAPHLKWWSNANDASIPCHSNEQDRIKHRADGQKWAQFRAVIVHWDQSIKKACLEDLPDDFEEMEKAVLYGDALDDQILGVLKRFPPMFNVGMLPDIRAEFDLCPKDTAEREMMEAANRAWESSFEVFSLKLHKDWQCSMLHHNPRLISIP